MSRSGQLVPGKTATDEMAQQSHAEIRNILSEMFGQSAASSIRILYGGSMKPENAPVFLHNQMLMGVNWWSLSFSKVFL